MKLKEIQEQLNELQKELNKLKEEPTRIDISNWEENGIIPESAKIIVAPEDYWEEGEDGEFGVVDGKKRYFTWDEAMAVGQKLGDGWRLPTTQEMMHLVAEFGLDKDGDGDSEKFIKELGFGLNGYYNYINGNLYNRGSNGYYWEGKAFSGTYARYLGFSSTYLYPQSTSSKGDGFSVRLVKDLKEEL